MKVANLTKGNGTRSQHQLPLAPAKFHQLKNTVANGCVALRPKKMFGSEVTVLSGLVIMPLKQEDLSRPIAMQKHVSNHFWLVTFG